MSTTETEPAPQATTESTASPDTSSSTSPAPAKAAPPKAAAKKKDKNDANRFQGEGINFNAKLIGVDDVAEARGDRMCQDTIYRLKISVKASGQHKQRIIVNVSEEGIKLIDLRTGVVNYTHAVHKISFISRDVTDRRAFGYVFGVGDGTHKFFGIKTQGAAETLVLTLRDLFQIVYEKKKKEMEEVKQQQEDQETTETVKTPENPNVLKLSDGELNTESSTDDDPTYQVPTNNGEVRKEERSMSNLVDLKNELETIEQGIEQMNKFECEFDSLNTDAGVSGDPWASQPGGAAPATQGNLFASDFNSNQPAAAPPASSASSDLQDIDLLDNQPPATKKKEEILNLFGPQQPQMPGFGVPLPQPQAGAFGAPGFLPNMVAQPFPGTPAPAVPNPFAVPGFQQPAPVVHAPFGAPMPGQLPPVPQRPGMGAPVGMAAPGVPPTINPFANDPFAAGGVAPSGGAGGFGAFPNGPSGNEMPAGMSLLDEPVLAPVKVATEQEAFVEASASKSKDAFGDLVNIGGINNEKSPKALFSELNSKPKKSMNQLLSEQKIGGAPQASTLVDPFGSLDNASLPAVVNFSSPFQSSHLDPFDTSFLNPSKSNSTPSVLVPQTNNSDMCFSDNDDFNLPSPDGPPPPLPSVQPPCDSPNMPTLIPPAPPPRPSGSPLSARSHDNSPAPPTLPCRSIETPPELPPRNSASEPKLKTTISPVPRPRPRAQVNGGQESKLKNNNNEGDISLKNESQTVSKSQTSVVEQKPRFVVEDPFTTSDPFAESDPFTSSFDGFPNMCNLDVFSANDPFVFGNDSSSSQSNPKINGSAEDDPFAVFDKSLNDSFNKSSNSRKNSKKRKNSDPLYATVNKPKPKS